MPTSSLSSRVYEQILARILSGGLPPGTECNRRQIAGEMGVSVAPVLEAMLQLEADGLVETLPRVGTRVRVLTLDDLQGQLVLREALECQAARLYCGAPVRRHFERLTRLARTIDVRDPTSPEHVKEEIVFHHSLVSLANVRILTQAYTKVMKTSFLYAVQTLQPAGGKVTRASHVQLVQSLTTDNADAAETAARAHAQSGKEALFDQWAAARRALGDDIPGWPG